MYYVYILTNKKHSSLYIGVTNNIQRRVAEHRAGLVSGFTKKYNCTLLVYVESFKNIQDAILNEKKIKGWKRCRKIQLIESRNPNWDDLVVDN